MTRMQMLVSDEMAAVLEDLRVKRKVRSQQEIIKLRFSEKQIEELQAVAWWNLPDAEIKKIVPMLLSEDVDSLISYSKNKR